MSQESKYKFSHPNNIDEKYIDEYLINVNLMMDSIPDEIISYDTYIINAYNRLINPELYFEDEMIHYHMSIYTEEMDDIGDDYLDFQDKELMEFLLENEPSEYLDIHDETLEYPIDYYRDCYLDIPHMNAFKFSQEDIYDYMDQFEEDFHYPEYKEVHPLDAYYDSLGDMDYPEPPYYNENLSGFYFRDNNNEMRLFGEYIKEDSMEYDNEINPNIGESEEIMIPEDDIEQILKHYNPGENIEHLLGNDPYLNIPEDKGKNLPENDSYPK